jgi:hypothetical protein
MVLKYDPEGMEGKIFFGFRPSTKKAGTASLLRNPFPSLRLKNPFFSAGNSQRNRPALFIFAPLSSSRAV